MTDPAVVAVASDSGHNFSKPVKEHITLVKGLGVEGDAHLGVTVQHLSRIAKNPDLLNLRQVHLIHSELFDALREDDFHISPGLLGENITTRGVDLLDLPTGALLSIGKTAIVEITGLRNPCHQLNQIKEGLMQRLVFKNETGELTRLCGIMGIVRKGGDVRAGDSISVTLPPKPFQALERV